MLRHGAPPVAGRLAAELIARGSVSLAMPACARCGRDGRPLFRTAGGGMCKPCAARVRTAACAHCGEVKAIAGRDASRAVHLRAVPPACPGAPRVRALRA